MQPNQALVREEQAGTRSDAIRNGDLIDVSDSPQAPRAKLRIPTAITKAAWERYVAFPPGPFGSFRLWDILWMASITIRQSCQNRQVTYFRIPLRDVEGLAMPKSASLKAVYSYDEHERRVVTIMLPEE